MLRSVIIAVSFLVVTVAGCESEKDQFSGLSDLVAERNEVRRIISKETTRKKKNMSGLSSQDDAGSQGQKIPSDDTLSSVALYEKYIEVVDSQTGMSLAKGVAYLDKKGRIVRIKIHKK